MKPEFGLQVDTNKQVIDSIKHAAVEHGRGNWAVPFPKAEVLVPGNILVGCPMVGQSLIQAKECLRCAHFHGVVQIGFSDDSVLKWDAKYAISCGFPIDRKCKAIVNL